MRSRPLRLWPGTGFLLASTAFAAPAETPPLPDPVPVEELFAPRATLAMKLGAPGSGKVERVGKQWSITGNAPFKVEFIPAAGDAWDLSEHRLLGIPLLNKGSGIVTIRGRLNNAKPTGWSRHAVGFAVTPAGEPATLGFPFPIPEDQYKGPAVFADQLAKPDGHRVHWRRFDPADTRSLILDIHSSAEKVDLLLNDPFLAWLATPELASRLGAMPYLDALGQVRAVTWPGKAKDIAEARATLNRELKTAALQAKAQKLSRYGGWLAGPKLDATGHFRTAKVDGRWWLVDPEGYLFFSVGACLAGHNSGTLINQKRLDAGFFAYLPDDKDYLRWAGRKKQGGQEFANFPAMNYQRILWENWKTIVRNGTHNRMRAWGVNTLGGWSDEAMQRDGRTPYTLIASIWWRPSAHRKFPSPFRKDFGADLRKALGNSVWAKDDPFCLGIFLGNELDWPDQFSPMVFELAKDDATKLWVLGKLQEKYPAVADLNASWNAKFSSWDEVLATRPEQISPAIKKDIEPLYLEFTTAFFSKCKAAVDDVLPNKLYLGCRTHRGPNVLGRGARGHVDVFSVNAYDSQVRSWQIPADIDMPILAGEFHFGAVDRGVPSPGLSATWDQRQRGLAFTHYLASALADPRFVGVHWFQWIDQPASGRRDRENHQVGFIDVAGRAYPEFTEAVSKATRAMYRARTSEKKTTEAILEELLSGSD